MSATPEPPARSQGAGEDKKTCPTCGGVGCVVYPAIPGVTHAKPRLCPTCNPPGAFVVTTTHNGPGFCAATLDHPGAPAGDAADGLRQAAAAYLASLDATRIKVEGEVYSREALDEARVRDRALAQAERALRAALDGAP